MLSVTPMYDSCYPHCVTNMVGLYFYISFEMALLKPTILLGTHHTKVMNYSKNHFPSLTCRKGHGALFQQERCENGSACGIDSQLVS